MFEEGRSGAGDHGPFANFSGFVDEVLPDKEKVRVMVQVFGRATPVVLDYVQRREGLNRSLEALPEG